MSNLRQLWPGTAASAAVILVGLTLPATSPVRQPNPFWPVYLACLVTAGLILNASFWWLLKAPTAAGRKLLDDIEGFRRFLETCYRGRPLLRSTEPGRGPAAIAEHLPYAMALDIDTEAFSVLDTSQQWYEGRSGGFSSADFTGSLRRMTPRMVGR